MNKTNQANHLGDIIYAYRINHNYSQQRFADEFIKAYKKVYNKDIDCSFQAVSKWELGNTPAMDNIIVLSQMLEMRIDELIFEELESHKFYEVIRNDVMTKISKYSKADMDLLHKLLLSAKAGNQDNTSENITVDIYYPLINGQGEFFIGNTPHSEENIVQKFITKRLPYLKQESLVNFLNYYEELPISKTMDFDETIYSEFERYMDWQFVGHDSMDSENSIAMYDSEKHKKDSKINCNICNYQSGYFNELCGFWAFENIPEEDSETSAKRKTLIEELAKNNCNKIFGELIKNSLITNPQIDYFDIGTIEGNFPSEIQDFDCYVRYSFRLDMSHAEIIECLTYLYKENLKNK